MLIINSDQIKHHFLELIRVGYIWFSGAQSHIFTQVTIQIYPQTLAVHYHGLISKASSCTVNCKLLRRKLLQFIGFTHY